MAARKGTGICLPEVERFDDFCVLGLQRWEQFAETGAQFRVILRRRRRLRFMMKRISEPRARRAPAVRIDNRPFEYSIEPGDERVTVSQPRRRGRRPRPPRPQA